MAISSFVSNPNRLSSGATLDHSCLASGESQSGQSGRSPSGCGDCPFIGLLEGFPSSFLCSLDFGIGPLLPMVVNLLKSIRIFIWETRDNSRVGAHLVSGLKAVDIQTPYPHAGLIYLFYPFHGRVWPKISD
jgi:hypothetical protein